MQAVLKTVAVQLWPHCSTPPHPSMGTFRRTVHPPQVAVVVLDPVVVDAVVLELCVADVRVSFAEQ
jgi:hypothetical protein